MKDVLANHILPRMPLLAKLSLQILSRSAAEALAKHCPQLESLTLTSTKYDTIDPDAITPLLHHCSRLKHLDAIWHAVEAASLVTSPVVCRGLEVFRCQITGIGEEEEEYEVDSEDEDWENTGQEENDKDDDDNEEINTAERRLTELRVLELGVDNVDGYDIMGGFPGNYLVDGRLYYQHFGPTLNTLELSLQSGLDRLKTLKKLQVFGFEGVDHRIGIDELTWMAENWPQLQVMHGIQAPDEKDEYSLSCPKVKELREHMQRLRPLVKHEVGRS
ncbi:hypothetical protein BGW39_009427 [Mortierella sp. 14UC]|nr:hypothetical protein BGW39_009427 [Mortierella sp. 14UC]